MTKTPMSDAPDLCRLGVDALTEGYGSGAISPVEVAEAALARAEAINPAFNAFTFIDHAGALDAARASEARWRAGAPLSAIDGVPATIKDLVRVKGWTVRYGSQTTDPTPYVDDAPSVARLRAAGAVLIGQTTSPEFGWKAVTDTALNGITRNPWNPVMTPGGSSGGAAVAAATGAGVLHLGTDGAGSIRIPCAFCGISGIKPTFGRVPAYPLSPFGTIAHIGPMTRRVSDTAHMLRAMSGRDALDWVQGFGALGPLDDVAVPFKGVRIGVWSTPPCGDVHPEVAANFAATVQAIEALGATVEPIDLPFFDEITAIFEAHWFCGAAARLAMVPEADRGKVDPDLRDIAARGANYSAPEFIAAQTARGAFGVEMDALLERYDFIVAPGTAIPPFAAGQLVPDGVDYTDWHIWAGFTFPINLSQQPAAVVPSGLTADGLPLSFQIIGARGKDMQVLGLAQAFETAFPQHFL
jgi:amidase/aspartyl-tRNA(Asn)/glutamyl-tRNA(Gln) amidotransferase subunit A